MVAGGGGTLQWRRFVRQRRCHAGGTGRADGRLGLSAVAGRARRGTTPPQVAAQLGNDVSALGSAPAALTAFLVHPDDAYAAIRFAVRIGGDTDTIAAMTGALCGARLGSHAVPRRWYRRLEAADQMATLATDLARLPASIDSTRHGGQVPCPEPNRVNPGQRTG